MKPVFVFFLWILSLSSLIKSLILLATRFYIIGDIELIKSFDGQTTILMSIFLLYVLSFIISGIVLYRINFIKNYTYLIAMISGFIISYFLNLLKLTEYYFDTYLSYFLIIFFLSIFVYYFSVKMVKVNKPDGSDM
jgi:hypothetical protein